MGFRITGTDNSSSRDGGDCGGGGHGVNSQSIDNEILSRLCIRCCECTRVAAIPKTLTTKDTKVHEGHQARFCAKSPSILPGFPLSTLLCSTSMAVSKKASTSFQPDSRQQEAIEHVHGPMLVVAGAGTGKTTVLTRRIARL